ncbi:MAG TPA: 1-pyrroline-5-carboxylate dehydrogenase, partial [Flavisolibacter sp.]|nr:1-pyrroline-5-carboxylate dehydrogenase [Flavisolibacter sp.]
MSFGYFSYPVPANEPVLSYAPGSAERAALRETLAMLKSEAIDVPMYIGADEVRTGKLEAMRPPHE